MSFSLQSLLHGPLGAGLSRDEYFGRLNTQTSELIAKTNLSLDDIRELLILSSAESCGVADEYFISQDKSERLLQHLLLVIDDKDDFGSGDARIQAAYYLRMFDDSMLKKHADVLKRLLSSEDGSKPGGSLVPLLEPICGRLV